MTFETLVTPRLPDDRLAAGTPYPAFLPGDDETDQLVRLGRDRGAHTVAIGCGRDPVSRAAAASAAALWAVAGGRVVAVVDWPETAASWLRQARRLTSPEPDLWILGGPVPGFVQTVRRLAWSTTWTPARTLTYACLEEPTVVALAGRGTLCGLSGRRPDGSTWSISDGAPDRGAR